MNVIYLPQKNPNPYVMNMWDTIKQFAFMKAAANIRAKEAEAERNYEQDVRQEEGKVKMATAGYRPVREMSKEHAALDSSGDAIDAYGEVWGPKANREPQVVNVQGQKFVTFDGNNYQKLSPDKPITDTWEIGGDKVEVQYTGNPKDTVRGNPKSSGWSEVASGPRYKPGQTNVNVNMGKELNPYEKKFLEKQGEGTAEAYTSRNSMAQEAINQNNQLQIVKNEIKKGARTGYGEETILNLKSLGQTLGIDTGDLGGQELIRKISNEMALRLRNPESGLGLTGNTSNKDLDFLKNSVIGLARTEAGNLKIIEAMERLNKFKIDIARKQQELVRKNGNIPPMDLEAKLLDYANSYKLFSPQEVKKIRRLNQPVVRTGTYNGRKIVEFADGTVEYAD